ncbi:MAG: acyltransferase family protein [Clostridia bacterium]|nr:acyltransferase family protein [Clostridia bacterium]
MMFLFFGLFVLLCLYKVQLKPKNGEKYMTDYMSVEKTMSIKGIFILIVFFSHFNSYVTFSSPAEYYYVKIFHIIGQAMVTLFLFYSGYGVMESIKKKGMRYVHKIPVTRILGTYFRFDIAVLIFIIVQTILGNIFPVSQYLLSFTGWDAVGNSNWYIFAVIVAYFVTFVSFEICRLLTKKASTQAYNYLSAVFVTLGCLAYIFVLAYFKLKSMYWFDTIICYACGIWYSLLRDKIEKKINKNFVVYAVFFIGTAAGTLYFMLKRGSGFVNAELYMLFFVSFVVIMSMRVSFHNKILMWCGKNLFGLYIMQRIPMIVFKAIGVADFNVYLYFVLCVAVTVPVAWAFEKYTVKLWNLITSPKKKTA